MFCYQPCRPVLRSIYSVFWCLLSVTVQSLDSESIEESGQSLLIVFFFYLNSTKFLKRTLLEVRILNGISLELTVY
jgi:hypothetical protein